MHDKASAELLSMLLPLHFFYEREGGSLPPIALVDQAEIPEPEKSLLVHDRDMTSTLGRFHQSEIGLRVLRQERSDDYLMRMVVLHRSDGRPVEFGAIGVRLEKFEGPLREDIAEGRGPLGGLLEKYLIDYRSAPKGYFRVEADQIIASALDAKAGQHLFGRCNELTDPEGFAFADIVEVVPAAAP